MPGRISPVRVLRDGRVEKEGICRGADTDGALLVQTAAGVERCLSGDLSLRRDMMIAIDAGNTRIKWGVHDGAGLGRARRAADR